MEIPPLLNLYDQLNFISSKDLRPGNIVYRRDCAHDKNGKFKCNYIPTRLSKVGLLSTPRAWYGIQLTPWLIEKIAGPEVNYQSSDHAKLYLFDCGPYDRITIGHGQDPIISLAKHGNHLEMKYLHEFQNIYTDITGNELEFLDRNL